MFGYERASSNEVKFIYRSLTRKGVISRKDYINSQTNFQGLYYSRNWLGNGNAKRINHDRRWSFPVLMMKALLR